MNLLVVAEFTQCCVYSVLCASRAHSLTHFEVQPLTGLMWVCGMSGMLMMKYVHVILFMITITSMDLYNYTSSCLLNRIPE